MLSKVSRFLHVQPRHWSDRIPRVFWAKTLPKSPKNKWRHRIPHIGCPHASALECSSQNPKRYQYANGLTRQCLAFVQPHTATALWGNQNMLWAWWDRYDSVERLHKSKQVLACHSHIRFWTVSAYDFFFLDVDRIHSSEKEKQQNPKSWVQFCWCPFSCG